MRTLDCPLVPALPSSQPEATPFARAILIPRRSIPAKCGLIVH
jgi:hypothetical protein